MKEIYLLKNFGGVVDIVDSGLIDLLVSSVGNGSL